MPRNIFQASTAVFLLLLLDFCHCSLMKFESENGDTSGRTMPRSRASGRLTVLLTRAGQQVTHCFSTASTCRAQVHDARYSNDGLSDEIQVSLDGTAVGTFRTRAKSNYGYAWNEFVNASSIGGTIEIHPGNHELTLSVISTDRYGVELDKTTLQLTCEGSDTAESEICQTGEDTATQDSTTTEGGTATTPASSYHQCQIELEAENGDTSGRTMSRSQASGGLTIYLTRVGQHVIHTLSTDTTCTARIRNVRYSNDGQSDDIQVSLDGTTMGTFRTRAKSNYGYAWNEFVSTNSFGRGIEIPPGNHELKLIVTSTDRYGLELDKTTLQLTCEDSDTSESGICPTTTTSDGGTTTTPASSYDQCLLEFEAENGDTSGRTMSRTQASGGYSVYLTRVGQHVAHTYSADTVCTAQVDNVIYSNDGQSDVIQVSLDGIAVGTFRTRGKSNYGNAWNEFLSTDSIGEAIEINPGNHTLTLSVTSTDHYGVELDKTTLQLTCEGSGNQECSTRETTTTHDSAVRESGATSPPARSDPIHATPQVAPEEQPKDSNSLGAGEITGIVLGTIVLVAILITTVIVVVKYARKKKIYDHL